MRTRKCLFNKAPVKIFFPNADSLNGNVEVFEVRDQLCPFRLVITAVISVFSSLAVLRVFLSHYFTRPFVAPPSTLCQFPKTCESWKNKCY